MSLSSRFLTQTLPLVARSRWSALSRISDGAVGVLSNNANANTTNARTQLLLLQPQQQRRGYRGDTGEAVHTLTPKERELLAIAEPRAEAIRADHTKATVDLATRRKRLIYRAKQRGWLEVDLLLGTWASENVPTLGGSSNNNGDNNDNDNDELDQFEDFVNMETIDIYNVITLRLGVPEELKRPGGTGVVERIQEWARSHPLGRGDPETYKAVKTEHKLI
eukprot:jgi/Psemu1/254839/estExt_Genewise1Plus.C_1170025